MTVEGGRAQQLRESYTASELAVMLAKSEELLAAAHVRIREQAGRTQALEAALNSIASGDWTPEGARIEARRAVHAR